MKENSTNAGTGTAPPLNAATPVERKRRCTEWLLYSLVALAAFVSIFALGTILMITTNPSNQVNLIAKEAKSAAAFCRFPELLERPIFCIIYYTFQVSNFSYGNVPSHLCRHVLLCCLSSMADSEKKYAVYVGRFLSEAVSRTSVYLGFGGPYLDYGWFNGVISSDLESMRIAQLITKVVQAGLYNGGVGIIAPDVFKINKVNLQRRRYERFVLHLRNTVVSTGPYVVVAELPARHSDVTSVYNASTLTTDGLLPIMPSHLLKHDREAASYATCASPRNSAGKRNGYTVSLERVYEDMKYAYRDSWSVLEKRILFTFSLAWLQFLQAKVNNRSAGVPATYKGTLSYSTVCTHKFTSLHSRIFHDYGTDCHIYSDGEVDWYSGLGEESGDFIRRHPHIKGLAIYDIEFGDFSGLCRGFRYPQLQAIYDVFHEVITPS